MKKISIFLATLFIMSVAFGQNVIQKQGLSNAPSYSISKSNPNNSVDFEQLAKDLESVATKTPDGHIRCFSNEYNEMLRTKYPQLGSDADFESWIAPKIEEYNNNVANGLATQKVVVTIPVIMHIIHNSTEGVGTGRNISQAQATSQITILNNDFRKLNSDTSLIPAAFQPLAADLEINFVPALRYASNHALAGNTLAEPGIDRISAPTIPGVANTTTGYSTTFIDGTIKPNTYWDRTEVMNIWVCQISGGILGYAQFPTGSGLPGLTGGATGANTDGLVLLYTATGTGGVAAAPYNKGRTATHEIGHWFGLRHIWGDEAACAADDYVTDTPQQKSENYGCPSYPQTTQAGGRCSTGDPSSMFMNYMDYTDDACMFMFTQGQKGRVVTVLANSPGRMELPTSTLGSPLTTTAQFSGTPLSIPVGNSVTFTDQSISPNTITTWNWTFTGGTPNSFIGQNPPAIVYNTPGNYTVSLTVTDNTSASDNETKTAYINVFTAPTCDTLNYPPNGTIVAYTTGAGLGYVIGSNQYLDKAKAEYISSAAHAPYTHVTGGRFAVRSARDGGNGATVTFNVWDATGPGGSPGAVLGSVTVTLASLNTNPTGYENNIQQVMFPTAINVGTAPYFFGFVMNNFKTTNPASTKDTLGLFSNTSGDSNPGTAWEQQSDNLWYDVDAAWGGLPITAYLSPIMSQNAPGPVLTTNSTNICMGGSINYDATASTNTLSYSWIFNGGTPGTSATATQAVTYAASGSPKTYLTLTGNCGAVSKDSVTITVNSDNTVSTASSSPSVCVNTAITSVTHTTTGATGIGAATGLPSGVSANWSGNTITISGTPTASGTFTYNIPLTGGCGSANATGTITVTSANTVSVASSSPTLCINTAMTNITHTTTGATGIGAATGLPSGVSANWSGNMITISGTPTASGTFTYSIPLTGGCGSAVNATGTITVNPNMTVSVASSSPTLCINTAMTNITHTTTGAIGIGAATGLPSGVSANWSGNTITISGTPTASGTFTYSIPLTGGCGTVNATGTITVTPNNTVSAASSSPTVCINTAMTNITHTTTGATGIGAATGLPLGISANWSGNTITISGTPTASGTFTYSIPLAGGCGSVVNATGTITVNSNNTVTPASSSPTVCINNAITNITHTTTGATGIGVATGLPSGLTVNWSGNTITISGTPTASGTFTYSIPLTGGCGTVNATGVITINSLTTPTFTAVTPQCSGSTISALPTTSNNSITGVWSPAINNTTTTTYTFTPNAGQCAATTTMVITIDSPVTPTFTAVTPQCSGSTISALPTTSNNGITGTWSPAIDNTTTTTYTFTPTAGQCADTATMTISIVGVINTQESAMVCNFGSYTFPDGTTQTNITSQVVYNSTLTSSGGCDSIVETTVDVQVCTGIEKNESDGIIVFPNPVNKLLTVQTFNSTVSQIKMINILGEVIVNKNTINSNTTTINVEGIPKGIYFIQLSNNKGKVVLTQKVVVN
ncbi:MAG: PKD domain-containing protein [Flavobacteriales bacterium]